MKKKYLVTYEVKAYREKDSSGYNTATARMETSSKNKLEAINLCLRSFAWDRIYEKELGYLPKKIEFERFISVEVIKEA